MAAGRPTDDGGGPPSGHDRAGPTLDGPVTLVEADQAVARPVRARGGPNPGEPRRRRQLIEHVGSTSVPGMPASRSCDIPDELARYLLATASAADRLGVRQQYADANGRRIEAIRDGRAAIAAEDIPAR